MSIRDILNEYKNIEYMLDDDITEILAEIKKSIPPKKPTYPGKRNRDANKYNEARKHIIKALFGEEKSMIKPDCLVCKKDDLEKRFCEYKSVMLQTCKKKYVGEDGHCLYMEK